MLEKRPSTEDIVGKLRGVEVLQGRGGLLGDSVVLLLSFSRRQEETDRAPKLVDRDWLLQR